MIEFSPLFFPLTSTQILFYSQFTTLEFSFLLQNIHPLNLPEGRVFGLEVLNNGSQIGLLLGSYIPILEEGEIISIFLQPEYRNRGIGTRLFKEAEQFLLLQGCKSITICYKKEKEYTVYLEKILAQLNWSFPKPHTTNLHFIVKEFHPAWHRKYNLPENLEIISWFKMTEKEKEFLIRMDLNDVIPATVSPFHKNPESIEPINSLILRYQGTLVGWIVSNRITQDTIQYSSLFFFPEWRNKGWFIFLLSESIRLQQESSIPKAILTINLQGVDLRWIHFVKKQLFPYAHEVDRFFESQKEMEH